MYDNNGTSWLPTPCFVWVKSTVYFIIKPVFSLNEHNYMQFKQA